MKSKVIVFGIVFLLSCVVTPALALIEIHQGALLENESYLYRNDIAPDGSFAVFGGESTEVITICDVPNGIVSATALLPDGVESEDLEITNSGSTVFVGTQGGGVYCFDNTGTQIWNRSDIIGEVSVGAPLSGDIVYTVGFDDYFHQLKASNGSDVVAPAFIDTRESLWAVWDVDSSADGDRVLLRTNSDIIITDSNGTEIFFYDIVDGNSLTDADISPDGDYFAVAYIDPDTELREIALYEIGVGEKWTKDVSAYTNVSIDDNNWVFAATNSDDNVLYNTTGTEITRWSASGYILDVSDNGSACVVSSGSETYAYHVVDEYDCYPDLHLQAYVTDVMQYDADTKRYTLSIANWYELPAELFVPSPELPMCGINDKASRTYIRIYGSDGSFFYSGCGATIIETFKNWNVYVDDDELDEYMYMELWDRKCDITIQSNYAYIGNPCPIGDLDGNCIVDLLDFALLADNWLIDNN